MAGDRFRGSERIAAYLIYPIVVTPPIPASLSDKIVQASRGKSYTRISNPLIDLRTMECYQDSRSTPTPILHLNR